LEFEVNDKIISRFAICALFLLLAISSIMPISGLKVGGSILETNVTAGEHIKHVMTVSLSEGELATEAEARIMGYATNMQSGTDYVEKDDDENPYSASGYFEVSPESFSLEPGVPVEVLLEGDVPVDAGSGGRYALVEIHTAPHGNGTVGFSTAIIVPIRLTINGTNLAETGEIVKADISEDDVLSISFNNTGNHHYKASAEAILKDKEDKVIGNSSSRRGTALPAVPYPFTISLNPEGDLASGIYTVEISMIREDGMVMDTDETTFEV
jgi:hypothetical protein